MRRVVVTGMGAITPMGLNVKEYFDNIKAGNHDLPPFPNLTLLSIKLMWQQKSKDLLQKNTWILMAAKRMEPFPNMQWQQQKRPGNRQDLI